jgi:pyruvate kinase
MRPDIPILALTPTIRNARYLTLVKNIVPAVLDPRYKKKNKKRKIRTYG